MFVGDSSCNQALSPRVWTERTGRTALNLCRIGDFALVDDAWLLREYIRRNGPPKRVIVQHVYDVWHRPLRRELLAEIPRTFGFWSDASPPIELTLDELRRIVLLRWLPVYGKRESIEMALTTLVRARHFSALMEAPFTVTKHGFMPWADAKPDRVERDAVQHRAFVRDHQATELSSDNERALASLAEFAEEHRFDVYLVSSPVFDGLAGDPVFQQFRAAQLAMLADRVEQFSRLHLVSRQQTFSKFQMENVDHVVGDAAAEHTKWVADKLR